MTDKSLKHQAEEIMEAVDQDLKAVDSGIAPDTLREVDGRANAVMKTLFNVVSDVDLAAAARRVQQLKAKYPDTGRRDLAQILIREKCQRTGAVGAVTSGAGLVPGLGTAAAVTLGVAADIGATFKLQAELVLEIAAVYEYPLSEQEKERLVLLITGISAGTSALTRRAGQTVTVKVGEKVAERAIGKTVLKALPVVGVIASAGTNVLSTYIIGQRADAYFRLGPEAVGSWTDSLRTVTGLDERKLGSWLAEGGRNAGQIVSAGVERAGEAGRVAGGAIVAGASRAAETTSAGAQKAGETARTGLRLYLHWLVTFWTAVFRFFGKLLAFFWQIISFVPRKIVGLFKR
jgi:hypothetical protein